MQIQGYFLRLFIALLLILCGPSHAGAQAFSFASNKVDVVVASPFTPLPLAILVKSSTPGFSVTNLQITSDSSWVSPTPGEAGTLVLRFATSNLVNQSYTATLTARSATHTNTLYVRAFVSLLNVTRLMDDPWRSRTYGVHQNGSALGALVVLNPITGARMGSISVGMKPSDLDLSRDGRELFVINSTSQTISVIDLTTLTLKETIRLPQYIDGSVDSTWGKVAAGSSNILYYVEGGGAPMLHILERSAGTLLMSIMHGEFGYGDIVVSPDGKQLFGWAQAAGNAGSFFLQHRIEADGRLTLVEQTENRWDSVMAREPLNSPILISADGQTVFAKGAAVAAASVKQMKAVLPGVVRSITPGGEVFTTDTAVYETTTGRKLGDLPKSLIVQTISSDYSRIVYFDPATRELRTLDLLEIAGPVLSSRKVTPADDSITLPPAQLQWPSLPGVDRYQVYLGTSGTEVASAQTNSATYQGEVTTSAFPLSQVLIPGQDYYWRADGVNELEIMLGEVFHFKVSSISSSTNVLRAVTFAGHRDLRLTFDLAAAAATDWQLVADQPWIRFAATNGTTPSTVEVLLDSTGLATNSHNATVSVRSGGTTVFTIPVSLRVEPLNLKVLRSDPKSVFAYGVSEDAANPGAKAYLIEINTLTETISRIVPAGSGVTDIAIHPGDNRVYVANWNAGLLLAMNQTTLSLERSYKFTPGGNYSSGEVHMLAAGTTGRLMVETRDNGVLLYDTTQSNSLASTYPRSGGGAFEPSGRYYYHGDYNSSLASLRKIDCTGDVLTELSSARVEKASFYGSRTVVVSEQGNRIFWNGGVFKPDLTVEWEIADFIYAASPDGRLAFGHSGVYDVQARAAITNNLPAGPMKAFNSVTSRLVYNDSTNQLRFQHFDTDQDFAPANGAILSAVPALQWQTLPATSSYLLYLGRSFQDVAVAGTNSAEFLGSVWSASVNLPPGMQPGTYFWRHDAVTPYGIIPGTVHSFTLSPVLPNPATLKAITFPDRPVSLPLQLQAPPGTEWSISTDAEWVTLLPANGVGNGAVHVTLSPKSTVVPTNTTATLTVSGASGVLFTLPVRLTVEALNLTSLKSVPGSHLAYAISQVTTEGPAYLLEIDTQAERIDRLCAAGEGFTDFAFHPGDDRVYIVNSSAGMLRAINTQTFQQERVYKPGVSSIQAAAASAGRLVLEGGSYTPVYLLDTVTGNLITNSFSVPGGGGYAEPTGHFYYHGDQGFSDSSLHKFNLIGDGFAEVGRVRATSGSYWGASVVVGSEDGKRIFWNQSMFDPDLTEMWTIRDDIFATSSDGALAFSRTKIYGVNERLAILGMPVETAVSAFNSVSRKLVVQQGSQVRFFPLPSGAIALAKPTLSAGQVTPLGVMLTWADNSLETGFTIQRRVAGTNEWVDIATTAQNVTNYHATGLSPKTAYEFRVKADALSASSEWSETLAVTTPGNLPSTPTFNYPVASSGSVSLQWTTYGETLWVVIERAVNSWTNWTVLTTLGNNVSTYEDTDVISLTNYSYRLKARNLYGESAYTSSRGVTVPLPSPPVAPGSPNASMSVSGMIVVTWQDVVGETGYRLERRTEWPTNWTPIATLTTNTTFFHDTSFVPGTEYFYRVQAFNSMGDSPYSSTFSIIPRTFARVLEDDFDPAASPLVWSSIEGGVVTNGIRGFLNTNALYFSGQDRRAATTVPMPIVSEGLVKFLIRCGNEAVDGSELWNDSEAGDSIVIEYSLNGDAWITLNTYTGVQQWTPYTVSIPAGAISPQTMFRWRQVRHSGAGFDTWAIDDVVIYSSLPERPEAPVFILASATAPTTVAIIWTDGLRAGSYILQRSSAAQVWTNIAELPPSQTWFADVTALPGTEYYYRVKSRNISGDSPYSLPAHAVTLSQQGFWLAENAGITGSTHQKTLLEADPEGVAYLLKYAFNLNADEPAAGLVAGTGVSGAPAIWVDALRDRLCVEYVRRRASLNPGVTYAVQFSDAASRWGTSSNEVSVTTIDAIWERVRVEDSVPCSSKATRFARVIVTNIGQ